eukprot:scaffold214_cov249-Pinguiococcus_pyrenoidosus.AAC.28
MASKPGAAPCETCDQLERLSRASKNSPKAVLQHGSPLLGRRYQVADIRHARFLADLKRLCGSQSLSVAPR